jgi:hypothetical protein
LLLLRLPHHHLVDDACSDNNSHHPTEEQGQTNQLYRRSVTAGKYKSYFSAAFVVATNDTLTTRHDNMHTPVIQLFSYLKNISIFFSISESQYFPADAQ